MRSILVPLFYIWLGVSVVVLVRRRVSHGSFGPSPSDPDTGGVTAAASFPPPPPTTPLSATAAPDDATVAVKPATTTTSEDASQTLADAIAGITMPCDLMPLITERFDPRAAAFSTYGYEPITVGTAVADEFERLGFALDPLDPRTIDAVRGSDHVQIRLTSATLESADVMEARYPQARPDALVVEIRLI